MDERVQILLEEFKTLVESVIQEHLTPAISNASAIAEKIQQIRATGYSKPLESNFSITFSKDTDESVESEQLVDVEADSSFNGAGLSIQ